MTITRCDRCKVDVAYARRGYLKLSLVDTVQEWDLCPECHRLIQAFLAMDPPTATTQVLWCTKMVKG